MVWGTEKIALDNVLSSEARNMQFKENNDSRTYGTHEGDALSFIVYIHADQKQPLLRELDSAGVNEKTLFPGLDGIGRYIEQKYRFVYDETVRCF